MSGEQAFNPKFLLPESVFTRQRFSAAGSMSNPAERISSGNCMQQTAAGHSEISGDFDTEIRDRRAGLYSEKSIMWFIIKEGAGIVGFSECGARRHVALMESGKFLRIVREVRNTVNQARQLRNCQYYQDGDSGGEAG